MYDNFSFSSKSVIGQELTRITDYKEKEKYQKIYKTINISIKIDNNYSEIFTINLKKSKKFQDGLTLIENEFPSLFLLILYAINKNKEEIKIETAPSIKRESLPVMTSHEIVSSMLKLNTWFSI